MNENTTPNATEVEFIWRRLVETVKVGGFEIAGYWWLAVLIPVLLLAVFYVLLMYRKDMRSVGFKWAAPLALLRLGVYAALTYVFLMPAKQTYERVEKRSRVLVVLDISDSMRINESASKGSGRVNHRLNQVLDYLNDDTAAFLGRLVEKNPVFVYRIGSRLDEEYQLFEREFTDEKINQIAADPDSDLAREITKRYIEESRQRGENINPNELKDSENNKRYRTWLARQAKPVYRLPTKSGGLRSVEGDRWNLQNWEAFANYDFKQWLLRGISPEGQKLLTDSAIWEKGTPGNAEWARKWLEIKEEDAIPAEILSSGTPVEGQEPTPFQKDLTQLRVYRERLKTRIDLVSTITDGTNIPGSLNDILSRETGQMVQGVIVISDGRSTSDVTSALADLKAKSKRDNIPLFTVLVGSDLKPKKSVLITDVLAPEVTTPDDPFRITVEIDGPGQIGNEIPTDLFVRIPGQVEEWIPIKRLLPDGNPAPNVRFDKGEPPHAQVEFVIDPEKVPEELLNRGGGDPKDPKKGPVSSGKKELREGEWQIRAAVPNPNPTNKDDEKKYSEPVTVKVRKKPARVLLFCNAPSRDFQFLLTQLLRDQADVCLVVQNEGGTKGEINLLDDANRQLVKFPDRLIKEEDDPQKSDPKEKWYNLAMYDVIIAFDPDWNQLTAEQIGKLRTWVEINAGGLMFIAGPQYTKYLGRPDDANKMTPLLDILPVVPGDPDLDAAKRDPTKFWRLEFENLGVNTDYMIIDDKLAEVKSNRPDAGWDLFFTGREDYDPKATVRRGFYGCFPLREVKKAARILARFTDPNSIRLPDGSAPAWLCDMPVGRGKTIWLGSGETWRLRSYSEGYFERFWTKLIRTLGAGSAKKQGTLSRNLFSKEVSAGSYFRIKAQLFDVSMQPLARNAEPKARLKPIELSKYDARIDALKDNAEVQREKDKVHEKFKSEVKLAAQKGDPWEGYFLASQMLAVEKYPPGVWSIEIDVPTTSETLRGKFVIKESRPETDNATPDGKSMYQMASELNAVLPRVSDKNVAERLNRMAMSGEEGKRLSFRFEERENIEEEGRTARKIDILPDVMLQEIKTQRNRAGLEDLWDKGPKAPEFIGSWFGDKEQKVGWFLIIAASLLSLEWLTRKLLKLA
ncbi:MAG: hypothetical protein N2112_03330 [Gemmataceae bacterium]|jgi:hypothetical protein|nr:hypothetical protein [Gemmataceae bacterium]